MNATWSVSQLIAVGAGAAFGAVVRWWVGLWLNQFNSAFPMGTLLVNCVGGLLIGAAFWGFSRQPHELLRLLLVTGFLGGLTTFSAFSAESLILLQRGEWRWALVHTLAHVLGALGCTAVGYQLAKTVWNAPV